MLLFVLTTLGTLMLTLLMTIPVRTFAHRVAVQFLTSCIMHTGVGASNDVIWKNNRRFTLRQLRDLGMGKSKLVAAVQTQAKKLVEELKKQDGEAKLLPRALNVNVVNVIWQMIVGE